MFGFKFKVPFYLTVFKIALKITKPIVYNTPWPVDNMIHDFLTQAVEDKTFVTWFAELTPESLRFDKEEDLNGNEPQS